MASSIVYLKVAVSGQIGHGLYVRTAINDLPVD